MCAIDRTSHLGILSGLLALLLAGCATTTAPRGWLPDAANAQQQAYGGWITLMYRSGSPELQRYDGELIAVGSDSVYVLTGDTLRVVSRATVEKAKVMAYDSHAGELGAWTFLGCLSTISHGFVSGITAPLWLFGGGCATIGVSRRPQVVYENPLPGSDEMPAVRNWDDMRPFARFPFGLPPDCDRNSLRAKIIAPRP